MNSHIFVNSHTFPNSHSSLSINLYFLGNQPALDLIHDYAHCPQNQSLEEVKHECYREMKLCLWRLKVKNEFPDDIGQLNLFLRRMKKRCQEHFVQYFFDKLNEIIDEFYRKDFSELLENTLKNEFFEEIDIELKTYKVYKSKLNV